MKRWSPWLVALVMLTGTSAFAQRGITPTRTNTAALRKIATSAEKDYRANRAYALKLAKERDWVIEKTYKDGTYISLQGVDAKGLPIYYITYNNASAAATTKTDQLWAGGALGLSLSGGSSNVANKLGIWDGGRVRATHQELAGRITQKDNPGEANDHATHVAGTMVASGVNASAKGMAFGYKSLQAYDFNGDDAEMAAAAKDLLVSNHSYGNIAGWRYNSDRKGTDEDPYWEWWGNTDISSTEDYTFGYYDEGAAIWDEIAYNAPYYLIVKSAGNNRNETGPEVGKPYFQRNNNGKFSLVEKRPNTISSNNGYDVLSTASNAKNILTVGAVAAITSGYSQPSDVKVSSFSSWGPTDDGRIKPDVVGNGVAVLSTSATNDRSYEVLSGTSMASPNVSGTLLLLQEHYSNLHNGQFMRAATLKGLAIHTADEAGTTNGPDYVYGWGLLNAERAASVISNSNQTHLLEERLLAQGETHTFEVKASGTGPLKITISWTDPKAEPIAVGTSALNSRTPKLINDLDVRVAGNNKNYLPWTLNPAKPADAAKTGDNVLDNVEQVYIADAVPGQTYTVTIKHKGSLAKGPQAYSLLASGVGGNLACTITPATNTGAKISSLTVGSQVQNFDDACTTYRNLTGTVFSFEPSQTKQLKLNLTSCGTDANKVAKVFVDWNGNGVFTNAGETITSDVISNNIFTTDLTAPGFVKEGNKVRMRVVVQEATDASAIDDCTSSTKGEAQDYLIQYTRPQKDVGIAAVTLVGASLCETGAQSVQVTLRNFGSAEQRNIPVAVKVLKNGTELTTLRSTFTGTLAAYSQADVLLSETFATEAGASYELVAQSALTNDAVESNNQRNSSFHVATGGVAPVDASAYRCGEGSNYTVSAQGDGTPFWYTSPTSTTPVAAGNQVQVPVASVGTTLYAAFNDFSATVGAPNKAAFPKGNYNQFGPSVLVSTMAPVVLEQARLYIGNSGKITFTVYDSNGAPVSSRTLNVTATTSKPGPGEQPDDLTDQGQLYYLGLQLPRAGNYSIAIAYEDGATIYRNNGGVTGYPFGVSNVFSIIGNTATTDSQNYYYYFYDLKVRALGCAGPRVAADIKTGAPLDKPSVTRKGQELISSAPEGNQWYLDGEPIQGATGQSFAPTFNGKYSVVVFRYGCISDMSLAYSYELESSERGVGPELMVFPNPSTDGKFNYTVETRALEDMTLTVVDMVGKHLYTSTVKQVNGQYKGSFDLSKYANGLYIVHLQYGSQTYSRKVMIRR